MKRKLAVLASEDDLLVNLTFHNVPTSLLTEFAEKIVIPYYSDNINAAVQGLFKRPLQSKTLSSPTLPKSETETAVDYF